MRKAFVERKTLETEIKIELCLDGKGSFEGFTVSGFFNHMLEAFAKHAGFDLVVEAKGDTGVDLHHTVEDTGIVLGEAFREALKDKSGIARFGYAVVPMDEALVMSAVDISGRGSFFLKGEFPGYEVGGFPVELVEEFFVAFSREAKLTLHIQILSGKNLHHTVEALFKSVAKSLKDAVRIEGEGIPSTKGTL